MIDGDIEILVGDYIRGKGVKLAIRAPQEVDVSRQAHKIIPQPTKGLIIK